MRVVLLGAGRMAPLELLADAPVPGPGGDVQFADPEHRGLGVTPGLAPSSPTYVAALRRPARRAVWLAALSIVLMLATLSLPETPLVTARDIAEDEQA